jgi:hypothetical protein
MHLRIHWSRPSNNEEPTTGSLIIPVKNREEGIEVLEAKKEMCVFEGYGRTITRACLCEEVERLI